ncbi:uncharacterized protein VP01_6364g2, partial [Puccinia sorghi]
LATTCEYTKLKLFNEQLVSTRKAEEWGMQSIQGVFACLKLPFPATHHAYQAEALNCLCNFIRLLRAMFISWVTLSTQYSSLISNKHVE